MKGKGKNCKPKAPNGAMKGGAGKMYMAEGGDVERARRMGDHAQGRKLKADFSPVTGGVGQAIAKVGGAIRGNPQNRTMKDSADTMAKNRRSYKK